MGQPSQYCLRRKAGQLRKEDKASKALWAHPAAPRNPPHSLQASPQPEAKPLPPHRQARRAGLHRGHLAAWCPIHPLAGCLHPPPRSPRRIFLLCPLLRLPLAHPQLAPQQALLPQGMIPVIIPAMRPELCRPPCQTANRAMRRIHQCHTLQCHILLAPMRLRRMLAHRGEMLFMAQASYRAILLPTGDLPPNTAIRKQAILLRL